MSDAPLIAIVCAIPLLGQALCDALDELAECKVIPARQDDIAGLLKSMQPDAIVVDAEDEAESAATYSRFARIPVIHVDLSAHMLRLYEDGRWEYAEDLEASPEGIRNLVASGLYGRRVRA